MAKDEHMTQAPICDGLRYPPRRLEAAAGALYQERRRFIISRLATVGTLS